MKQGVRPKTFNLRVQQELRNWQAVGFRLQSIGPKLPNIIRSSPVGCPGRRNHPVKSWSTHSQELEGKKKPLKKIIVYYLCNKLAGLNVLIN